MTLCMDRNVRSTIILATLLLAAVLWHIQRERSEQVALDRRVKPGDDEGVGEPSSALPV